MAESKKTIINASTKTAIDRLNKYGDAYVENKQKYDKIQEKIDALKAEQAEFEKDLNKQLDAAYNFAFNTYGDCDGVVTDKYKFAFNSGLSTNVPKDLDTSKIPEDLQKVKVSLDIAALKKYYYDNGRKIPTSLTKLNITIEETKTIHCDEIAALEGSVALNKLIKKK